MKHRLLSLILALVLVLALFPASALANESSTVPTVTIG